MAAGVGELSALGIDPLGERVYRLLLKRPGLTARQLTETAGLSAGQTRSTLASLCALGLAVEQLGPPARFHPGEPGAVLEPLIREQQAALERARGALGGFRRSYRDAGIGTDLTELVAVIHGADATAELVLQLLSSATVSVERFNKPPFVGPQLDQLEVIRARVAAGVRARDIYDHEAIDAPDTLALVRWLTDSGGSVRVARMVPMKLLLIDRSAALIPLSTSEPGVHLGALLVRASSLLEALSAFFEAMWDRAAPFALHRDARGRASSGRPDEAESLLAFLAAGFKDEAIARRLGVAPSTVDRRMRRLMHDLDARTRFQAGVHATRRGWVAEEAAADPGPFGQPNGAGRLGARRTQ